MTFTRPPIVRAIALAYLLSPIGNVLQAALASGDSTDAVLGKALSGFGAFGTALVLGGPVAGIGLYSGQRWGFVAFFAHALALLIDSGVRLAHGAFGYRAAILLVDLAVLVAIALVLQEDIRAPFLSDAERGWRLGKRLPVGGEATVEAAGRGTPVDLVNISTTGVLVRWRGEAPLAVGAEARLTLARGGAFGVRVVRVDGAQVAFAFVEVEPRALEGVVRALVRAR